MTLPAPSSPHIPVMLDQVLSVLSPTDGEVYVDGTFGAGGYARAILDAASCAVVAIDRDPAAQFRASVLSKGYGKRLVFLPGCFSDADFLVKNAGYEHADGFILDLGVSSMQLDEPERGFSFRTDGPLDMRMNPEGDSESAADIVNHYSERELADLIYQYGQEHHSRHVARAIVQARAEKPITRTLQLADIVRRVVPRSKKDGIDPATRTFQALRIAVNRELDELRRGLEAAERLLREGGRLIVVSFHSLEDTIVKDFLRERSGRAGNVSRHLPLPPPESVNPPTFTLPSGLPALSPSETETSSNPRSRSARMRVATRTAALPWGSA